MADFTEDEVIDLTEAMRDLGVQEFTYGPLTVKFREGTVVPREADRGGKSAGEHAPPARDLRSTAAAQGIGPPRFPGSAS